MTVCLPKSRAMEVSTPIAEKSSRVHAAHRAVTTINDGGKSIAFNPRRVLEFKRFTPLPKHPNGLSFRAFHAVALRSA